MIWFWASNGVKKLGVVKWDFNEMVMEFEFGNKHHVLRGARPQQVWFLRSLCLALKLLDNASQFFMLQLIPSDKISFEFKFPTYEDGNG